MDIWTIDKVCNILSINPMGDDEDNAIVSDPEAMYIFAFGLSSHHYLLARFCLCVAGTIKTGGYADDSR